MRGSGWRLLELYKACVPEYAGLLSGSSCVDPALS